MSLWLRERGAIGLARDGVAWRAVQQADSRGTLPRVDSIAKASDLAALKATLAGVFATEPTVRSWKMVLAIDVARPFVFDAPEGVRNVSEMAQLARLRAARLFGGVPVDWEVSADWKLHVPSLCAAAPASALEAIRRAAREAGCRVEVVAAASLGYVRLWGHANLRSGDLAWPTPGNLLLANIEGGNLRNLRCVRVTDSQDAASWVERVRTEAAREAKLAGRPEGSVTFAWPGPLPESAVRATKGLDIQLRWLDSRKVLPAWPGEAMGAAAWSALLALGEAS